MMAGEPDDYDDFDYEERPEGAEWCDRCQGMGIAECHCGGDQCYCENYGEMECPTRPLFALSGGHRFRGDARRFRRNAAAVRTLRQSARRVKAWCTS